MAVAADGKHAGTQVPALGQHDVADALRVVEVVDTDFLPPLAGDADDVAALLVVSGEVVIGDDHHLRGVPDLRVQALEHRLEAARSARVVHHGKVDLAGDDLARRHRVFAAGAGTEFLRERLFHFAARNSFNALSGGWKKFERRLTENIPVFWRNLTAISAVFASNVTPFTTGAPSNCPPNNIIGRPPAGTMTSAPASSSLRHSRSHLGFSLSKAFLLANASM